MTLRPYTAADHPLLARWWQAHLMAVLPPHAIPPFSWLVDNGGTPKAFACAYLDNGGTGVALITWITTNPDNRPRESYRTLTHLLEFMRDHLATALDYTLQLSLSNQPGLSRLLQRIDFHPAGTGYTEHFYSHGN